MAENIVTQLIEEKNKRDLSIPKLAKALNIPQARIYKWISGEGNPKGADIQIIKAWLKLEEVPNKAHDQTAKTPKGSEEEPLERIYLVESVRNLTESSRINAEADKMMQRNLERLITMVEEQSSYLRQLSSHKQTGEPDVPGQMGKPFRKFSDIPVKSGKQEDKGEKKGK